MAENAAESKKWHTLVILNNLGGNVNLSELSFRFRRLDICRYFNDKNTRTPKNYQNAENATLFLPQPLNIVKMTKMQYFFTN